MSVLIVTGTGTEVGKTVATAAFAACGSGRVAVVKPAQTGVGPGEPGDLTEVTRLSGVTDTHEYARYPDPLSPHHASAVSGQPALDLTDVARRVLGLNASRGSVIVEGAGGLLVPFGADGWTVLDLAVEINAPVVVVTRSGLGTLNHTALTVDRLNGAGVKLAGIVLGAWPPEPDLATRCNLDDLARMGPIVGVLPTGLPTAPDFRRAACAALIERFGGRFDWTSFAAAHAVTT